MWLDLGEYRGPSRIHAFVSYAIGRTRSRQVDAAFRSYVTESLRLVPQGQYLAQGFDDVIRPHEEIDVEAIIERVTSALERG